MGFAYIENVNHLLERIALDLAFDFDEDMQQIYDLIEEKKEIFKEEWLSAIYNVDVLYAWEKNRITGQECARRIRAIIS